MKRQKATYDRVINARERSSVRSSWPSSPTERRTSPGSMLNLPDSISWGVGGTTTEYGITSLSGPPKADNGIVGSLKVRELLFCYGSRSVVVPDVFFSQGGLLFVPLQLVNVLKKECGRERNGRCYSPARPSHFFPPHEC